MVTANSFLREARLRAGLSQVELARRARVTQSVVSAYESGARQPSLPTLERLIAAAGFNLELRLEALTSPGSQPLSVLLRRHRKEIQDIAASHGFSNIRIFGSVSRNQEGPDSDIDLLVDVAPGVGLLEFGRCQAELEALLGTQVDLVPTSDLKPGVADNVLADAKAL